MKQNIYIFRHGETDWNDTGRIQGRIDIELNGKGLVQAKNIAPFLKDIKFNHIYSSPLKRAFKTASIVANDLNIKDIIVENNLAEYDYGEANGLLKTEIDQIYGDGFFSNCWSSSKPEYDNLAFKGCKTKLETRHRLLQCVKDIAKKDKSENLLLSSHGFAIKQLIIGSGSVNHRGLTNCEIVQFSIDLENDTFELVTRIKTN